MKHDTKIEIEAAVFRKLITHLDSRKDVQNIDLMNLSGFCRNCLAKWYSAEAKNHGENIKKTSNSNQIFLGYFFAFITGLLNGSLSAGTGLIFTMSLITFFGLDYKNAIAYTLIIVGFFYNAMGAIILSFNTDLYLILLPSLIFGSLMGGYIGAKISLKKSNKSIRRIYQLITITVGISLII